MDVPEEATTGKKNSRNRTNKIWLIDQKFVSSVEAIKYVKNQQEWSFYYKIVEIFAGPQCAAGLHLHFCNDSHDVISFKTDAEHTHTALIN